MKRRKQSRTLGPLWLRLVMLLGGSLCMGMAVAVAVQWVVTGSVGDIREWFEKWPTYLLLTGVLCGAVVFTLGALLGRLWLSALLVSAVGLLLALVDYFKTTINGTPLALADFGLATQLGDVAGVAGELHPPEDFWRALIALCICAALLFLFRRLTAVTGRARFLTFSISLALTLGLFSAQGAQAAGAVFQVDVNTRLDAANSHDTYGLLLSLWRDSCLQAKKSPEGYSEAYMQDVLARIDEILAEDPVSREESAVRPNVIMVLSESFYDLTRLPDLQFERDPLENFHALESESISGTFHSHYLGYGTGYLEMSMLYGITELDLGAGTNICFLEDDIYDRLDALPEQYTKGGGYTAEMLHAFDNSLYNRTVTYPRLGFSKLLFHEDMKQMDLQEPLFGGYYMRDAYLYEAALNEMKEINDSGERAFLYLITMENHQPFNADKFDYLCQIDVTSDTLSEEDMAIVRVMLEGITRADQALGKLTDALRDSPEPTIVVYFGDHRPNLFMTDGETVYTKLGLCPSNDTVDWTLEEVEDLYSTDYLIWANDAALLQGQAGTRRDSSITAVGPQLLELTGQPVSRYWALLEKVSQVSLTNIDRYFVDGTGTPSTSAETADLSDEARELLKLREDVLYDTLYGQQYITAAMNEPVP